MTEEEIDRQKEQIAKVRGAQAAMSGALDRISLLEGQLRRNKALFKELGRSVGPGIQVRTSHKLPYGEYSTETQTVGLADLMNGMAAGIEKVL